MNPFELFLRASGGCKLYRKSPLSDIYEDCYAGKFIRAVKVGWNHESASTRPFCGMRAFFVRFLRLCL
ncbi:hypothetical protein L3i20_v246820 [Paenibacillus sp. L3-i20]|nr:hypothetical protein L3i20_v246820 [Paenibacillus sp. L3-i20]